MEGEAYILLDEEDRPVEERPWPSWHWRAVPYSVEVSMAPLHPDGVEVLTIDHGTNFLDTRFGRKAREVPGDLDKYLRPK